VSSNKTTISVVFHDGLISQAVSGDNERAYKAQRLASRDGKLNVKLRSVGLERGDFNTILDWGLRVLCQASGKNFRATRPSSISSRFINHAHPPPAEPFDDAVMRNWFVRSAKTSHLHSALMLLRFMPPRAMQSTKTLHEDAAQASHRSGYSNGDYPACVPEPRFFHLGRVARKEKPAKRCFAGE
jgi:hypothetical protein